MSEPTPKLNAAAYARVSTPGQEKEETIESQIDEIRQRIKQDGHILKDDHIYIDQGWSGELLERPGLDEMRDAAVSDSFEIIYIYDRGRLSRIFYHQEIILDELANRDIKFVTLHDIQATTPEEKVLQSMQGVFHEYERIKIAERMRRGKLYKAKQGVLINGQVPYGYTRIKKTDTQPAHVIINDSESEIVELVYKWFVDDGVGLLEIIRRLHDQGIPSPRGKKSWGKESLRRLLKNEAYSKGKVYYNKSESVVAKNPIKNERYKKVKKTSRKMRPREEWLAIDVPRIIEDDGRYEKALEQLTYNKKYAAKNRKHDYLLSGLAWCECGTRRVGDGYKKNHYYRCAERIYKHPIPHECISPGINAAALDESFWQHFRDYLGNPKSLKKAAERTIQQEINNIGPSAQEKGRLQKQLDRVSEEQERYAKAYGTGTLEFEQFSQLMNETKQRKHILEAQLQKLKNAANDNVIKPEHIDRLVTLAKESLQEIDQTDKKKLVKELVKRVIIKGRKEVEVCIRIPLPVKVGLYATSRHCWPAQRR